MSSNASTRNVIIALMGPTGTGKSTFINLLTEDDNIRIGHDPESQTTDVNTSKYDDFGFSLTLVDTPGFDDSREGVTDTDILGKITDYLQEEGGRKLNGVIYLHRISDPRMSGMSKKNLRMFRELCGDKNLRNVLIVTTNWSRVGEQEGNDRETALAKGAFKPLIDAGAIMVRQDKELESAVSIIAQLILKEPVTMQVQEELNAGMVLGDTSAGKIILEETRQLQEKHAKEIEELKEELEAAERAGDEALKAELVEERQKMEEMIAHAKEDQKTLAMAQKARELQKAEQDLSAMLAENGESRISIGNAEDLRMVRRDSGMARRGSDQFVEVRQVQPRRPGHGQVHQLLMIALRQLGHMALGAADMLEQGMR